jgi:hypothetical protein
MEHILKEFYGLRLLIAKDIHYFLGGWWLACLLEDETKSTFLLSLH